VPQLQRTAALVCGFIAGLGFHSALEALWWHQAPDGLLPFAVFTLAGLVFCVLAEWPPQRPRS